MKTLYHFHPLDGPKTLWGESVMLRKCEPVDQFARLFRGVLWNSSCWSKTLHFCQQKAISLRSILIRAKSLVTGAEHNQRLIGKGSIASYSMQQIEQDRQRILNVDPDEQIDLARASFQEAVQTLILSDWDLSAWIRREGLLDGYNRKRNLWLSAKYKVVFDDSHKYSQKDFHQHILGTHIAYLPSFYYTLGLLVAQPYLQLEPGLSRLWDMRVKENLVNKEIEQAAGIWNEAFWENIQDFQKADVPPLALNVYPFNVHKADSFIGRFLKQVLPMEAKRLLSFRQ
jgi:hypothetical protein